jgi:hypothetical protein
MYEKVNAHMHIGVWKRYYFYKRVDKKKQEKRGNWLADKKKPRAINKKKRGGKWRF